MMAALTPKRRALSRGKISSKNMGQKSFKQGERGKKLEFPMWGGGGAVTGFFTAQTFP
jgi:hypothetical protein